LTLQSLDLKLVLAAYVRCMSTLCIRELEIHVSQCPVYDVEDNMQRTTEYKRMTSAAVTRLRVSMKVKAGCPHT
jgi:hypothetical protein